MRLGVEAALVGGRLLSGDVEIDGDGVVAVGRTGRPGSGIAAPGFVDLQVNGIAGVDFLTADEAGYATACEALLATGVTTVLPTLVTASEEVLRGALGALPRGECAPRIPGAHLEGPFLSPARLGAHDPAHRRDPDPALLERLLAAGPVALMTLAPELTGALELVDLLRARGVAVSLGHSEASADEANLAFDRGARGVTHVFNAMPPLAGREPGLAGAALARDDVVVQAIVDGVHLAGEIERLLAPACGGRLALVTDATAAAGLGDGRFTLGGQAIVVERGVSRREDGVLAGSTLTMPQAVRNLVAHDVPLESALEAASLVPAELLGRSSLQGLAVGAPADIVVLDDALQVVRTVVGGVEVYRA